MILKHQSDSHVFGILILSSFYLFLLVDDFNGFFLGNGINFPISVAWKITLSICIILWIVKFVNGLKIILSISIYIAALLLTLSFYYNPEIFKTINHLFRFIFTILIYKFLYIIHRKHIIYPMLIKIISFNTLVLLINILLILIGIGFSNYEDGGVSTSKGFFYAGNEVSGLFILLCPLFLYHISINTNFNSIKFWVTFFAITLATVLLGSKAGIVGTFFLNILVLKSFFVKFHKIKLFYNIILILFILAVLYGYKLVSEWDLWQRWTFFYEHGGIEKVFFSDRNTYWIEERGEILNGNLIQLLFGLGGDRTVEMDFLDTFINYGVIGICIVYSFYFWIIKKVYLLRNKFELAKIIFYIDIVFLIFSTLAGHMIFSGMAAPFVAIINIIPLAIRKQNPRHNKTINYKKHLVFSEGYR